MKLLVSEFFGVHPALFPPPKLLRLAVSMGTLTKFRLPAPPLPHLRPSPSTGTGTICNRQRKEVCPRPLHSLAGP